MAKKSITLAGLIRRVNKELIGREDAIEIIMEARPNWTYEEAERLFDWMDGKDGFTSTRIADGFCEQHRHPYRMCIDQHNRESQTDPAASVVVAATAETTTNADLVQTAIEARAKKKEAKRQAKIAADIAAKKSEEEKHQPGKRPVLEAIFGRDWQRIVMEKVATLEGQRWLNSKIEMWSDEQDRIHAYNYLNSMDSLALLYTEFPGVKK
jgi:hypothetical protein